MTDAVLDEVRQWQNRPLDPVYPVVFFDALRVKIWDEGLVKNKAVYVTLALNPDGEKDVLGLCVDRANRGCQILAQGDQRTEDPGVNDILIAVVDGLKGFPEAIASVYPQTVVQTCIVHLIRNSLAFVSWKNRRAILPAIKGDISGRECRHGAGPAREVRSQMGQALLDDRPGLARRLGARDSVLRLRPCERRSELIPNMATPVGRSEDR